MLAAAGTVGGCVGRGGGCTCRSKMCLELPFGTWLCAGPLDLRTFLHTHDRWRHMESRIRRATGLLTHCLWYWEEITRGNFKYLSASKLAKLLQGANRKCRLGIIRYLCIVVREPARRAGSVCSSGGQPGQFPMCFGVCLWRGAAGHGDKRVRGCRSQQGSEILESSPKLKGERREESNANVRFLPLLGSGAEGLQLGPGLLGLSARCDVALRCWGGLGSASTLSPLAAPGGPALCPGFHVPAAALPAHLLAPIPPIL